MIARLTTVPAAALALTLGVLVSAQGTTSPATGATQVLPSTGPRRVEVLFLGHTSTHHDSGRFAPMLQAALAQHGFNFSYTTDVADLNAANLARYDALMVYANHTRITPDQEKALLDFVNNGKGFLPIHSASFCFQNSPAYIALVGAQFERHGTGEFTTAFTNTSHPVMAGLQPFQVWDETYVHTKHNPTGRTVLMERVDAQGREPWTWVRNEGKGRVFYTAYGHDERVWNNPNFHALIRNAITWAIGPQVAAQLAALKLQPLRYTDGIVPIPNYERRNPAPRLQQRFSIAEAAKHIFDGDAAVDEREPNEQRLQQHLLLTALSKSLLELSDRPPAYDDVGRLCRWDDLFPLTMLPRSRFERVVSHAIAGRRVRMDGSWHRPIGVRGWTHVVFRRERDGVRRVMSLDEMLAHLDAWDRTADRRTAQRRTGGTSRPRPPSQSHHGMLIELLAPPF